MAKSELDGLLQRILEEIERELKCQVEKLLDTSLDEVRRARGMDKFVAKLKLLEEKKIARKKELEKDSEKLYREREKIDKRLEELNDDCLSDLAKLTVKHNAVAEALREVDEPINREVRTELKILNGGLCNYDARQTALEATELIENTPAAQNLLSFLDLKRNTRSMYQLAVSPKEKRGIILELQNRDWRSIGVSVPELPHFSKFAREDGRIVLPQTPSLPEPPKEV